MSFAQKPDHEGVGIMSAEFVMFRDLSRTDSCQQGQGRGTASERFADLTAKKMGSKAGHRVAREIHAASFVKTSGQAYHDFPSNRAVDAFAGL